MTRLAMLVLVASCSSGVPLPAERTGAPVDLDALVHCVEGELRDGTRVAFCTESEPVCIRVARLARANGRAWPTPTDLRLRWLEHCGSNGLRLPELRTAPRLKVDVQRVVLP